MAEEMNTNTEKLSVREYLEENAKDDDKKIEILIELQKPNKKNLLYQRISAGLMLIFVVAILILVPNIISTLTMVKTTLASVNEAITLIEEAMESVDTLADEASTTMESIQTLADEGVTAIEGMDDALEKINEMDMDTLNNAIKDLSDVVEPMADFFNIF